MSVNRIDLWRVILTAFVTLVMNGVATAYTITATTVVSQCINDGSITLSAAGANGTLTYSLISGPQVVATVYPVTLIAGQTTFPSLASGTYVVKSEDQGGVVQQTTVTVPGNYQYPTVQDSVDSLTYCLRAYNPQGKAPFTYAISTTGPASGFGPYQSSNVFCPTACGPTVSYWISIKDACGNVFATLPKSIPCKAGSGSITFSCNTGITQDTIHVSVVVGDLHPPFTFNVDNKPFTDTSKIVPTTCGNHVAYAFDSSGKKIVEARFSCINTFTSSLGCYNCSDGTATITASGGKAPYRYYCFVDGKVVAVNSTGVFTGLPIRPDKGLYTFYVYDTCGKSAAQNPLLAPCMDAYIGPACPYDSTIYLRAFKGLYAGKPLYPVTFNCNNCSPAQPPVTITQSSTLPAKLFTNLRQGDTICVSMIDSCGADSTYCVPMIPSIITTIGELVSCRSFQAHAFGSIDSLQYGKEITKGVTFHLRNNLNIDVDQNTTGLFRNIPDGNWLVYATYPDCQISAPVFFYIPLTPVMCFAPNMDSLCRLSWDMQVTVNKFTDKFVLDTFDLSKRYYAIVNPPGITDAYFNDVLPGRYKLTSDSGCTYNIKLDTINTFKLKAEISTLCDGNWLLHAFTTFDSAYCGQSDLFKYKIYQNGALLAENTSGSFSGSNFAPIHIELFLNHTQNLGAVPAPYDSVCLQDSVSIIPIPKIDPVLSTKNINVCGHKARGDINFSIVGGIAPYTINIAGYTDLILNSNVGQYKGVLPGQYTMIVYDLCGASTSRSMSVIDSCAVCPGKARIIIPDTLFCINDLLKCTTPPDTSRSHEWYIDDKLQSISTNFSYTVTYAGRHRVTLIYIDDFCSDTLTRYFTVDTPLHILLPPDFKICNAFSTILHSSTPLAVWNTGAHQADLEIHHGGTYWATAQNECGSTTDSIVITQDFSPEILLASYASLCPDSSTPLRVNSIPMSSYIWSTGSTDSIISVTVPGTYSVTASYRGCTSTDSVAVSYYYEPIDIIKLDQPACIGKEIILRTGYGTNPIWMDTFRDSILHVDQDGIYTVFVRGQCKGVRDTISIQFKSCDCTVNVPTAFSPNHDGLNDVFRPIPYCKLLTFSMQIFNRWGEMVYESFSVNDTWDGTYLSQPQPMDVYICHLSYIPEHTTERISWNQNLTLIR
jgi:gliding motility-associated-like protein